MMKHVHSAAGGVEDGAADEKCTYFFHLRARKSFIYKFIAAQRDLSNPYGAFLIVVPHSSCQARDL